MTTTDTHNPEAPKMTATKPLTTRRLAGIVRAAADDEALTRTSRCISADRTHTQQLVMVHHATDHAAVAARCAAAVTAAGYIVGDLATYATGFTTFVVTAQVGA